MHNRKTKEYKAQFKSPNDVHHYWQNRVQTENEIRKRMIKTVGQDHHMTQSLSPEKT